MSLSSIDLWKRISAEGIASAMQCRTWAAEVAKSLAPNQVADGLQVLQQLIQLGKLSKYQAKVLAGQLEAPLRLGPWHVIRRLKAPLWADWLELQKLDLTKAESPAPVWGKYLSAEEVSKLQPSAPALKRGIQLANAPGEHLQRVYIPELGKHPHSKEEGKQQDLFLQVDPVEGQLLTEAFAKKPASPEVADTIAMQVGIALAFLYESGIVHGRVTPDRIYWDGEKATLVVDPVSVLTATLDEKATGLLGSHLPKMQVAHFLAPEFAAPGQLPTCTTDVFALGCTWWWLREGKPLSSGKNTQEIVSNQASCLAAAKGTLEAMGPQGRVWQHCLAPNASARFHSGSQFVAAFKAAQEVVSKGKVAKPASKAVNAAAEVLAPEVMTPAGDAPKSQEPPQRQSAKTKQESGAKAAPTKQSRGQSESPASKSSAPAPPVSKASPQPVAELPTIEAAPPEPVAKVDPNLEDMRPPASKKPKRKKRGTSEATPVEAHPSKQADQSRGADSSVAASEKQKAVKTSEEVEQGGGPESEAAAVVALGSDRLEKTTQQIETSSNASQARKKVAKAEGIADPKAEKKSPKSRRKKKRKPSNKWMVPVFGGAGFVLLLLGILSYSGALDGGGGKKEEQAKGGTYVPPENVGSVTVIEKDPMLSFYNLQDSETDIWVPPVAPAKFKLNLLPPGAGAFLSIRPRDLLADGIKKGILASLEPGVKDSLDATLKAVGLESSDVQQILIGYYAPVADGGMPQQVYRVELSSAQPLTYLRNVWQNPKTEKVEEKEILTNGSNAYLLEKPLAETTEVESFCVGPVNLIKEAASMGGGEAPLLAPVEKLWNSSSSNYDLSVIFTPAFLFGDGRVILSRYPPRLESILRMQIGNDTRAVALKMHFEESWYTELQLVGASDQEAGRTMANMQQVLNGWPGQVESWFVSETPHPYWMGLALRFPQQLRKALQYTRYQIEDGAGVSNMYLPSKFASNLMIASWTGLQDAATIRGQLATGSTPAAKPLTMEEYLARPISVSFDQEPIENALAVIVEEANDRLPQGTPTLGFLLDGDAFEAGGITRNQQLRDFKHENKSVRSALTQVAIMGNTTPGAELSSPDQKLIWVVTDDPANPGKKRIVLMTKTAATAANIPIPKEFLP